MMKSVKRSREQSEQTDMSTYMYKMKKYSATDPKQAKFLDNLPLFVASSLQSLSVVEDEDFRKMISDIDERIVVPSRKHLSTVLIPNKAESVHNKLTKLLGEVPYLSVTVDIWSNRQMRSFIGITAHFIHDWKLQTAMLACKRFSGRHTADNIIAQYEEVVNEFQISEKVAHVISDNAANMVKAFKLPGYTSSPPESQEETDIEVDTDDTDSELTEPDNELFSYFTKHDGCFAHTINLVVRDGMKEAGSLRNVITRASQIVSHVRKSTISTDLLEDYRKLQAANVTRWNSEVSMIRSVLRIPEEKLNELDTKMKLNTHDRVLLQELCDILTPFETATDFTQGDQVVTASLVLPSVRGLRAELAEINTKFNNKLVTTLRRSIERRLSVYEEQPSFRMAATLDPRFKLAW